MLNFTQYYNTRELLEEAAKANTHLTHLEELVLTTGAKGYSTARGFIVDLLKHLQGKSSRKIGTTIKWDGAPAIFAGKHPETGRFFVGTKSIFNKEPKINYTDHDIEINHGHAPGLADKLKKALKYLPKLGIKNILQGDFMFDSSTVKEEDIDGVPHYTFKPNTIKYAVEVDSKLGKEIGNSVFGIIFHTEYDDLAGGARFGANVKKLNKVPGVWVDDAYFKDDTGVVTLTTDESKQITDYIKTADSIKVDYRNLPLDLLNVYTNTEVRGGQFLENAEKSYNDFIDWYKSKMTNEIGKRKTKAGREKIEESYKKKLAELESEKTNIINLFKISKLLSLAKQIFINKYNNAVYTTKHFIDNEDGTLKVSSPEGYVAINRAGDAVKLVDRMEFSRANFSSGRPGSQPTNENI